MKAGKEMADQVDVLSTCFCGNKIECGIVCSGCERRLPVPALQKMYNLAIGALIVEKSAAAPSAEQLREKMLKIYTESLERTGILEMQNTENHKNKGKNPAASALGRLAAEKAGSLGMSEKGKKGSRRRAEKLTPERRSEIARQGAIAKHKKFLEKKAGKTHGLPNQKSDTTA